jgi:hypothetical protein
MRSDVMILHNGISACLDFHLLPGMTKCLGRQEAVVGPLRLSSIYLLHIIVYGTSG